MKAWVATIIFLALCVAVFLAVLFFPPKRESGSAVGRYVQFGLGPVVLDTTNGHLCVDYPEPVSTNDYPPICPWVKPWIPGK